MPLGKDKFVKVSALPGDRYGILTLVQEVGKDKRRSRLFVVKCDCGTIKTLPLDRLREGAITHCGCKKKLRYNDLTGQTFGRWTVIEMAGRKEKVVTWLCKCTCGNTKIVLSYPLRRGTSKSCGCYAKDFQRERIAREGWQRWKTVTGASAYVVEKDGKSMTLKEWAAELDIRLSTLILRWSSGWSDERILSPTPTQLEEKFKCVDPQFEPQKREA